PPVAAAAADTSAFARPVTFTSTTQVTSTLTASPGGTSLTAGTGLGGGEEPTPPDIDQLFQLWESLGDRAFWLRLLGGGGAGTPAAPPAPAPKSTGSVTPP